MILLGVGLPNAYPIQIPEVAPGIYRIRDSANWIPDPLAPSEEVSGFVIVWVK